MKRRAALAASAALPAAALATKVFSSASVEEPVGTPIGLAGTPHLFLVSADYPQLHWVGDTRALAQHPVYWNQQKTWPYWVFHRWGSLWMGDPYLSAGLLKDGDPIYLVKWEQQWDKPRLFHIQSIKDVELFGINASNYGKFVLDKPAWEAKYGFEAATLQRYPLSPATWGQWRWDRDNPDFPPGVIYYDRLSTPHGDGYNARLSVRCGSQPSAPWRVTLRPEAPAGSWFRSYTGPVEVHSPLFAIPVAATSVGRGIGTIQWDAGQAFVTALVGVLRNAETTATFSVQYPARGQAAAALDLTIRPAGIETAAAWLEAACAG